MSSSIAPFFFLSPIVLFAYPGRSASSVSKRLLVSNIPPSINRQLLWQSENSLPYAPLLQTILPRQPCGAFAVQHDTRTFYPPTVLPTFHHYKEFQIFVNLSIQHLPILVIHFGSNYSPVTHTVLLKLHSIACPSPHRVILVRPVLHH